MQFRYSYGSLPTLKKLLPGFQCICDNTMHVIRFRGLNPHGEHIALLHGIAACSATWMPLVRALMPIAKSFLLFDLPGHGLSSAAPEGFGFLDAYRCAEACLLKNLEPEESNMIIGNSLGGAFAFRFCADHPDYVSRCVLISPAGAPFPTTAEDVVAPFLTKSLADAKKIVDLVWTKPTKAAYLLAPVIRHTTTQPGFVSLIQSLISLDKNPDGELAQMIFNPGMVSQVRIPMMLIWGKQDKILPREMCAWFDENLPQSVARYFPEDLGHCPQFEAPGRVASEIIRWRMASTKTI